MKRSFLKFAVVAALLASLSFAIAVTDSELPLAIWFVLFIFVGIPLLLVAIADVVRALRGTESRDSFFSTGIHVTAVFAFLIGLLLSKMAEWSDHPFREKHAFLPLLFVAMVYGYPFVMWLKARASTIFFRTIQTEDELDTDGAYPDERDRYSGD